jgi:hypothetical protein
MFILTTSALFFKGEAASLIRDECCSVVSLAFLEFNAHTALTAQRPPAVFSRWSRCHLLEGAAPALSIPKGCRSRVHAATIDLSAEGLKA